jgi:YihY family inner membrane protein
VNIAERAMRAVDERQRSHPALAFPFAVVKKFGDDGGGRLGCLIAYYGFFSLFPLLLVLVSVLGFVLAGHPHLRSEVVSSALAEFPIIGPSLAKEAGLHALTGSWISILVGTVTALWAGLGVVQATEVAMNTVWEVPRAEWPNLFGTRLRALVTLAVLGAAVVLSSLVNGFGSSGASAWPVTIGLWIAGVLINLGFFLLTFKLLTAEAVRWKDLLPGALVAAPAWTVLQAVGGYYLTHEIRAASQVYGTFALVLALLVWISLGAQLTIYCAEINVVRVRHLWPRRLVQPPINDGDRDVHRDNVGLRPSAAHEQVPAQPQPAEQQHPAGERPVQERLDDVADRGQAIRVDERHRLREDQG